MIHTSPIATPYAGWCSAAARSSGMRWPTRDRRAAPVAIVRVEQLYPFPGDRMLEVLQGYPNAREIVWLQEEPDNMGPWHFVEARTWRLKERGYDLRCVSRIGSGSPATGTKAIHDQELADLMDETFAGL